MYKKSTVRVQDEVMMYSGEAWYFEISYGTTSGEKKTKGETRMNGYVQRRQVLCV